jgi:murein DD-endopeptidase MepM/ murein hydrolase activator NlpD
MKYRFDYKSLSFKKVEKTLWQYIKTILFHIATAIAFAVLILVIWTVFFESPKEKKLSREISFYKEQMQNLENRIDLLSTVLNGMEEKDDNLYRAILDADPIKREKDSAAFENIHLLANSGSTSEKLARIALKTELLTQRMQKELVSYGELWEIAKEKDKIRNSMPAISPVRNPNVVSGFGYRYHPVYKILKMHTGIDMVGQYGSPVYATADGVVSELEGYSGYGIVVFINHGYGYQTLYGHLSKKIVQPGQKVKRGQVVGYMGSTGLSVGTHLHYEVLKNGQKVNPIHYFFGNLTPEEYNKILKQSSEINQALS